DGVKEKKATEHREPRPGESKLRIELHCLSVRGCCMSIALITIFILFDRQSPEIGVISSGIVSRLVSNLFLLRAGQPGVELFGDCGGHLTFDAEDVVEFAIVTFGPNVFVRGRANKLNVNVNCVSDLLHATLENMCNAELVADLAQVVGRALIFLGRSSRDDLQSCDL